jgi:hypothetical protein
VAASGAGRLSAGRTAPKLGSPSMMNHGDSTGAEGAAGGALAVAEERSRTALAQQRTPRERSSRQPSLPGMAKPNDAPQGDVRGAVAGAGTDAWDEAAVVLQVGASWAGACSSSVP